MQALADVFDSNHDGKLSLLALVIQAVKEAGMER